MDHSTSLCHGYIYGLEHLHYSQTGQAIVYRGMVVHDAVYKVLRFASQSLDLLQTGNPKIAGSMDDPKRVIAHVTGPLNTFVVDLDLLVRLQIVPDKHLLFGADQGT